MQAAIIERFGGPEQLYVRELPAPILVGPQVLVRVRAAGLNPLDCRIRRGELRGLVRSRMPIVLGNDISGVVEQVGAEVTRFAVGDEVMAMMDSHPCMRWTGFAQPGAYAEYAVTREDTLALKPMSLSFIEAAALPIAALTAHQALVEQAVVRPGDRVLIHGAAGGVGSVAVQIAKLLGGTVTASCAQDAESVVRGLGAERTIDYRSVAALRSEPFHIIYDVATKLNYADWRASLGARGRFVNNVFTLRGLLSDIAAPPQRAFGRRRRYSYTWVRPSGKTLRAVSRWVEQGSLRPLIHAVYPLSGVADAHRQLERGSVRGKLVIDHAAH
jgi:NADPH:quinone reductase-like Zn-dependent oxidoreductase